MPSLFISHAASDRQFVEEELLSLFRALGFKSWFAETAIEPAESFKRAIQTGLEASQWFVVVMSSKSVTRDWVKREIRWAVKNRQGRVVPILIDDCNPGEFHRQLTEIEYIDFRNNRQTARERLIKLLIDAEYISYLRAHSQGAQDKSLLVTVTDPGRFLKSGDAAYVEIAKGCEQILNCSRSHCTWAELKSRAEEGRGKGTFWIAEMQNAMTDILCGRPARVMSSTFRGRGDEVKGKIFRPHLHNDYSYAGNHYYHFHFDEVLVPELVRGPGLIGEVFFLLYIASRIRWEVLNPFFVKPILYNQQDESELDEEEKQKLIGEVSASLRVIEVELERHSKWDENFVNDRFTGTDRDLLLKLLSQRNHIRYKVTNAIQRKDYADLMTYLEQALESNVEAITVLAKQFLKLANEDAKKVKRVLAERRNES